MTQRCEAQTREAHGDDIAIVGMACRFPGARTVPEYWDLLQSAGEAGPRGGDNSRHFLESIDEFDAEFFRTAQADATYVDPQQRVLLELTWETLEDAAVPPRDLAGTRTGVFIGLCNQDFTVLTWPRTSSMHMLTGALNSFAASRISHFLGLNGPSICVDTACSSSLTAVHMACRSLKAGECSLALVGGCNILTFPMASASMRNAGLISSRGSCQPFAPEADGFIRGEGAGMLLLKPHRQALQDGDEIMALISGSAINHNGGSNGLSSPNPVAQRQLLEEAYRSARIDPRDVGYLEASATGSAVADALESRTLIEFFLSGRTLSQPQLLIGTSKPAIGHVEGVSGIASLIKVATALSKGTLPGFQRNGGLNPMIGAEGKAVRFPEGPVAWDPGPSGIRIAGISSLGFGGSNAHVVVRQASDNARGAGEGEIAGPCVLPVSARSLPGLRDVLRSYINVLRQHPAQDLYSSCFTAATGREHFPVRRAFVATETGELLQQLMNEVQKLAADHDKSRTPPRSSIHLYLGGFGEEQMKQFRRLHAESAGLRAVVEKVADVVHVGARWASVSPDIDDPKQTALACFLAEYCLAEFLTAHCPSIKSYTGDGYSGLIGLVLAGAIGLDEAVRVVTGDLEVADLTCRDTAIPVYSPGLGRACGRQAQVHTLIQERLAGSPPKRLHRKARVLGVSWMPLESSSASMIRNHVEPATITDWYSLAEHGSVHNLLAKLYVAGTEMQWSASYPARPRRRAKLPHYPFQRTRLWPAELGGIELEAHRSGGERTPGQHLFGDLTGEAIDLPLTRELRYRYRLNAHSGMALAASRIFGMRMVTPATQVLMSAANLARKAAGRGEGIRLQNIRMMAPMLVAENAAAEAQIVVFPAETSGRGRLVFVANDSIGEAPQESKWNVTLEADYALSAEKGALVRPQEGARSEGAHPEFAVDECARQREHLQALGYECDPAHRWDLRPAGSSMPEAYWIRSPRSASGRGAVLHAGFLDACLSTLLLQLPSPGEGRVWLPVSMQSVELQVDDVGAAVYAVRIRSRTRTAGSAAMDFEVTNAAGKEVLSASGVILLQVQKAPLEEQWRRAAGSDAHLPQEALARGDTIEQRLVQTLTSLLGHAQDEEMLAQSLVSLGIDSMKSIGLRASLKRDYGYEISQVDVMNGLTAAALIARVREHAGERHVFGAARAEATTRQIVKLLARNDQHKLVQIEL